MTKDEKGKVLQAITHLAAAFDNSMSTDRQKIYIENLSDLSFEEVSLAITKAVMTCKFFPSIAELRELVGHGESKQALEDQAALAWDRLRTLRGKAYDSQALEDPIIRRCFQALGGAMNFGMWDYNEQEQWKRKEFISLYLAYIRNDPERLGLTNEESAAVLSKIGFGGLNGLN